MQRSASEGRSPSDGARRGPLAPFSRGRCQVAVVVGGLQFCRRPQVIREKKMLLPESPRALASGSSVEARTLTGFAVREATNRHAKHRAARGNEGAGKQSRKTCRRGVGAPIVWGRFGRASARPPHARSWAVEGGGGWVWGAGAGASIACRAHCEPPPRDAEPSEVAVSAGPPPLAAGECGHVVAQAPQSSGARTRGVICHGGALFGDSSVALVAAMAVKRRCARAATETQVPGASDGKHGASRRGPAASSRAAQEETPQPSQAPRSQPARVVGVWPRSGGGVASPAFAL